MQAKLAQLEAEIEMGREFVRSGDTLIEKGYYYQGKALKAIRDARLYRETHATFEDYCRERWEMERRTAYRYIDAVDVFANVTHGSQIAPANERQVRPLTKLDPDEQRDAWDLALENTKGRPTARAVQEAADIVTNTQRERPVSLEEENRRLRTENKALRRRIDELERENAELREELLHVAAA